MENEKFYEATEATEAQEEREVIGHCMDCGRVIYDDEDYLTDGHNNYVCADCMDDWGTCENCGYLVRDYQLNTIETRHGSEYWCDECVESEAVQCEDCGAYLARNMATETRDGYACQSCIECDYYYCDECNEYVRDYDYNSDCDMCCRCAEKYAKIKGYHDSHSRLHFIGAKDFAPLEGFGFELEVSGWDRGSGTERRTVDELDSLLNDEERRVFFERDGSIDEGFEIISNPHTMEAFKSFPLRDMLSILKRNGYESHNAKVCGLHLHFSRTLFGKSETEQERAISKVLLFYSYFWSDLLKASRRSENQANQWAKRYCVDNRHEAEQVSKYMLDHYARYYAVNLTNRATIEFRLGRGTLRAESFEAWIDLHYNLIKNAKRVSWENVYNVAEWLKGCNGATIEYLKQRHAFESYLGQYEAEEV